MLSFFCLRRTLFQKHIYDKSDSRKNHADKPKSHDDTFFFPADSFEVMMKRCNPEYFFSISQLFTQYLNHRRENLENVDTRYNYEDDESVRHHCHDCEAGTEREGSDITHVELGRLDIIPEKSDEGPNNEKTDGCENEKSFAVTNIGVDSIIKKKKSSRESIETIGDIDGICHRYHHEDEKWNIVPSDMNDAKPRKFYCIVTELIKKPPCSKSGKKNEES